MTRKVIFYVKFYSRAQYCSYHHPSQGRDTLWSGAYAVFSLVFTVMMAAAAVGPGQLSGSRQFMIKVTAPAARQHRASTGCLTCRGNGP